MTTNDEMYVESNQPRPQQPVDSLETIRTPLTLLQQTRMINAAIIAIKDGSIPVLKAELSLKGLENIIKEIRENKEVKELTINEAQKYGEKTFSLYGAEITLCNRSTNKFEVCNDSIWNDLKKQEAALKEQIKIREKQLLSGVSVETGEVLKQPVISTMQYLKIQFKEDKE